MRTDNLKYVLMHILTCPIHRYFWHNYCVLCIMELIESQHSSDHDRYVPCPQAASVLSLPPVFGLPSGLGEGYFKQFIYF